MLTINGELGIKDFDRVINQDEKIKLSASVLQRVNKSFNFLKSFSENKIIYGVNTGFGPMAQYKIEDAQRIQLQYNLIKSHAAGTGEMIPISCIKASMLARLNTLCIGKSGVNESVISLLTELINLNIIPVIYEHGGVGASGDLVQLAHLALTLIGEGKVHHNGQIENTHDVFPIYNLKPIQVELREGLAIMNGTSVMTGIGIINILNSRKILNWAIKISSAINEIVQAYDDHLSESLNHSKKHSGQRRIAELMRDHLKDSKLTRKREHHLYNGKLTGEVFDEKIQEYYSLRCVPQILGPVLDTLDNVEAILMEEVNSANDNPIVDEENQQVYHGGNFHGDYVSLEMDKLKLVITKTSILAERQLNYLLNSKLNNILPPFVNLGTLGLNFGMQGAQFTATSTTAENQMLSNSMYVHSIPNNNDNQDVVSMGTNAALITQKVINNTFEILAIELITVIQAIEYLEVKDKVSSKSRKLYQEMRTMMPNFKEDLILSPYIEKVKIYLSAN